MDRDTVVDFPLMKEEINEMIQEIVLDVLDGVRYEQTKVPEWTNKITQSCLEELKRLSVYFKYAVTCIIKQKAGGGLTSSTVCYWDEKSDGACIIRWESDALACIIVVFGIAI